MDQQLKDIKEIVPIEEPSLYLFLGLLALVLMLLFALGFWLARRRSKKAKSPRQKALVALMQLDFSDAKASAYAFTEHAALAAGESHQQELAALLTDLEAYKFKKEVPPMEEALVTRLKTFIQAVARG